MTRRRQRAVAIAEAAAARSLVVAGPSLVTWLTGFVPEIETGPSPFQLSALALLQPGRAPVLVVSEDEAEAAAAYGCEVASYPGFGIGPVDPVGAASSALRNALDGGSVAIDAGAFPAALARGLDWVDVGGDLDIARAVKDPDEIDLIEAGGRRLRCGPGGGATPRGAGDERARPLRRGPRRDGACRPAAGSPSSPISSQAPGRQTWVAPRARGRSPEGELVLCDLVPRVAGYWGDSCSTFAVGEAAPTAREAHARARETLEAVVAAVRPGAVAGELDALARGRLDFPHHTGHGLGTAWHEAPRIVPGSETVLEEGMVDRGRARDVRGRGRAGRAGAARRRRRERDPVRPRSRPLTEWGTRNVRPE